MKTREAGSRHKLFASMLAGSMAFSYGGGATLVSVAMAAPPAARPAAAPAGKPNLAEAKKHYGNGEKKYKDGDYAGALAEFQAADAIKSTPHATRYIGLCQEQLGHLHEAVDSYNKFLADAPAKMQTEIDDIKARVDKITKLPGHVHIESAPPGASVAIDGKPQPGVTPLDVDIAPGAHTVTFTLDKYESKDSTVSVQFSAKSSVSETLSAKPEAPPPPPPPPIASAPPPPAGTVPPQPPPENQSKAPAYITGGLAIVAAGLGTVFGIITLSDKSDYNKNPTNDRADTGENHALISDMSFFVAITLGVTSAVLFLTKDDAPPPPPAASAEHKPVAKHKSFTITPAPIILPGGGGAGALIQF